MVSFLLWLLEALPAHMESNGPGTVWDLEEVTLLEVVRFLGGCEAAGRVDIPRGCRVFQGTQRNVGVYMMGGEDA